MKLLKVHGLCKAFGGVIAVRDVSFELRCGEILALIGPNGAGKSTCFNLLNGQLSPDAGEILLDGRNIAGLSAVQIWQLGVGRTFQITATFGSMTVLENVQTAVLSHHGQLRSFLPGHSHRHTDETLALLDLVGMAGQAGVPAGILAYGDLKRLELAIALSNRPRLLLMDEPTAGMAPGERIDLMQLAASIARDRQIGILFTEHDMDVVFNHATRLLVLDRGQIVAAGDPDSVRSDPRVQDIYLGREAPPPPGHASP